MNIHKITQFLSSGSSSVYSVTPPSINNSGASLLVIVQALGLNVDRVGFLKRSLNMKGITEKRVILMGNAQAVTSTECSIEEFLSQPEYAGLLPDDVELAIDLISKKVTEFNDSLGVQ
jgi:hypothetical protein